MKVLTSIFKVGMKVIGKIIGAGAKVAKTTVKAAKWFKAHPKVSAFLGGLAADMAFEAVVEKVKAEASKLGLSEADIPEFENNLKYLEQDLSSTMKVIEGDVSKPGKKVHQSDRFWAAQGRKNSIFTNVDSDQKVNAILARARVRNLALVPFNMPLESFEPGGGSITGLFPNSYRMWPLDDATEQALKDAYNAYYARLATGSSLLEYNETNPTNARNFVKIVRLILTTSFEILSYVKVMQRYQSAKNIAINNNPTLSAGLLGSMRVPYSGQALAQKGAGIIQAGLGPDSKFGFNGDSLVTTFTEPSATLVGEVYSNKAWQDMLSEVRNTTFASQAMYEYIDWLFGGVHADKGSTEQQEVFVFFPRTPKRNDWDAGSYPVDTWFTGEEQLALKTWIETALSKLRDLLSCDKAITPILTLIGLGAGSDKNPFYSNMSEMFYRDPASMTLRITETDTKFYEAIANATLLIPALASNEQGTNAVRSIVLPALDYSKREIVSTGRLFMKENPSISYGPKVYRDYPEPELLDAGSLGSRYKFTGSPYCLGFLSTLAWSETNSNWEMHAPGLGFADLDLEGGAGNFIADTALLFQAYRQAGDIISKGYSTLADDQNYVVKQNLTQANAAMSGKGRIVDAGYQIISVVDYEAIQKSAYPYLAIQLGTLKEVITKLKDIKIYYAVNS